MSSNLLPLRSKHGDGDDDGEFDGGEGFIEVRVEGGRRLLWTQHIDGIMETDGGCLVVYNNEPLPIVVYTSYDDVKKLLKEFFYVATLKAKR